jgi:hypothetical protein
MKIKTSRLNVRKYTFVVRIVEIWNSLPESVIQAKTVKKFEIGLDEHWKHIRIITVGFIPLYPCIPVPISAYVVLHVSLVLFSIRSCPRSFLGIMCVAGINKKTFLHTAGFYMQRKFWTLMIFHLSLS